MRRKSDSSTSFASSHLEEPINSYCGSTRLFTICFSTIRVGLNQGPVSRKHANIQDSTCPELLSLKMLSLLSFININKDNLFIL